jgi:TetR/AcrR family transcriptional regulator, regulator of autoinduction and epiphytic fitness
VAENPKIDGRHLRSARSRGLVVEAILALMREGDMRPSAHDVARRAGVSERTVFRHFADLEQLFDAAAEHQSQRIAPLLAPPPVDGPRRRRIDELVRRRARLYEEVSPVRRAAVRQAPFYEGVRTRLEQLHAVLRQQLCATLAAELDSVGARQRRELLEALDAATSWPAWEVMRTDQQLSPARTTRAMELTVRSLLLAACGPDA